MSYAVANQLPVALSRLRSAAGSTPESNITRLLYHWVALPFVSSQLRLGRGLLPFTPGYTEGVELLGPLRLADSSLLLRVFDEVATGADMSRDAALRAMRLSPYHLVTNRQPLTDEETKLQADGMRIVGGILAALVDETPRFRGPVAVLWDTIVDALDPQSRAEESTGSIDAQRQTLRDISDALPAGNLPSPVDLDNAFPAAFMNMIGREWWARGRARNQPAEE